MGLFRQRAVIRPPHVVSFHHPRSPQAKEDESYATVTEIARKALNLQLARTPQGRRLPTCPSVPPATTSTGRQESEVEKRP